MIRLTLAFLLTLPVFATTIPNQVFSFTGTCSDCSGFGTATLTLSGSYVLGSPIQNSDFVSFVYHSNLIDMNANAGDKLFDGIIGTLPVDLGFAFVSVEDNYIFTSNDTGDWRIGIADFGTNGVWSQASTNAAAPEPGTWLLAAVGIAAVLTRKVYAR